MHKPTSAELYEAGMSFDEVEGFNAIVDRPDLTDNLRIEVPAYMRGVRAVRFRNGAAIGIRWRMMFASAQRRVRQARDNDRRQTGMSFIKMRTEPTVRPAAFLPAAIGPGTRP